MHFNFSVAQLFISCPHRLTAFSRQFGLVNDCQAAKSNKLTDQPLVSFNI